MQDRTTPASSEPPGDDAGKRAARYFVAALAAITALGCTLRCIRLGGQSFWIDEVLSYTWIQEIDKRGVHELVTDIHGPLHAFVIWLVAHVSRSEAALRAPSMVAGTTAVAALGLLGRALWGARAGLVAAALLAVSPFALYYSQECRNYAFTIVFAICSLWGTLRFFAAPSAKRAFALVLAEWAGIASNLNGLFFVVGLGAWGVWNARRDRRALLAWCGAHAALALLLAPYAWEITHQVRPERLVGVETPFGELEPLRGATTFHPMALPYTAFAFAAGYSLGPTLEELRADPAAAAAPKYWPMLALVVIGFGLPLGVGLARQRHGRGLLIVPAVVTAAWVVWVAATNVKPFNVRYLSVALPAFLLFVTAGLAALPRRLAAITAAAALVVSVASSWNYLFVPRYGRDDVRGVVRYVAEHAAPEDAILQISLTDALRYYYRGLGTRPVHPPASATRDMEKATAFLKEFAPQAGVVWYLECRPLAIDPNGALRKALESRTISSELRPFTGIRLRRFVLRPA
jgi:mannosyltransferase